MLFWKTCISYVHTPMGSSNYSYYSLKYRTKNTQSKCKGVVINCNIQSNLYLKDSHENLTT